VLPKATIAHIINTVFPAYESETDFPKEMLSGSETGSETTGPGEGRRGASHH